MANLTRWNPLRELAAMQNALDRMFDESWRGWQGEDIAGGARALALDVHEDDNSYVVTTALPGVKAENINIRLQNDYLTIEGEIPEQTTEKQGARSIMRERSYGRFTRTIRLPQPVNRDAVEATYEDGILKLTLPKAEEAQPRQIQVKAGSQGGKKS
jgi:HSP20 family protein